MRRFADNHTFAVCAYKESPYLEECIKSLKSQTVKSKIIITTSTPCEYIYDIAGKYGISVYVNTGEGGIERDWNFGYAMADTEYVTLAHQDDIYSKKYTETALEYMARHRDTLIFFSNYYELRDGKIVTSNKLLNIKRIMLLPLCFEPFFKSIFVRRRILSLGSAICCPSVTFAKRNLPEEIFTPGFRSNEDWEAWEKLSKRKGSFVYSNRPLMCHRIHEGSETSAIIDDNKRSEEDYAMYRKFWPEKIARFITKIYSAGQNSNNIE